MLVHCQSGKRSAKAAVLLEQLGYQDIRDMGGMNDWIYEKER